MKRVVKYLYLAGLFILCVGVNYFNNSIAYTADENIGYQERSTQKTENKPKPFKIENVAVCPLAEGKQNLKTGDQTTLKILLRNNIEPLSDVNSWITLEDNSLATSDSNRQQKVIPSFPSETIISLTFPITIQQLRKPQEIKGKLHISTTTNNYILPFRAFLGGKVITEQSYSFYSLLSKNYITWIKQDNYYDHVCVYDLASEKISEIFTETYYLKDLGYLSLAGNLIAWVVEDTSNNQNIHDVIYYRNFSNNLENKTIHKDPKCPVYSLAITEKLLAWVERDKETRNYKIYTYDINSERIKLIYEEKESSKYYLSILSAISNPGEENYLVIKKANKSGCEYYKSFYFYFLDSNVFQEIFKFPEEESYKRLVYDNQIFMWIADNGSYKLKYYLVKEHKLIDAGDVGGENSKHSLTLYKDKALFVMDQASNGDSVILYDINTQQAKEIIRESRACNLFLYENYLLWESEPNYKYVLYLADLDSLTVE